MAVRHFYVSSVHGTNTGTTDTSYASAQTGAMTTLTNTNVYDRLGRVAAITVPPTDGDIIYVADNHSVAYDNLTDPIFNSAGTSRSIGLSIISVDASNINVYKPGATEELNDGNDDYRFSKSGILAGLDLKTGDEVFYQSDFDSSWTVQDTTLRVFTGGLDLAVRSGASGGRTDLINVDIVTGASNNNVLLVGNNSVLNWYGGTLSGVVTTGDFFNSIIVGDVDIVGVDLSNHSGTLMKSTTNTSDRSYLRLYNCKLNSAVTLHGTLYSLVHRFEMYNCDDDTGDAYHRFYIADGAGSVSNNDVTYVTATESWYEGTDKSSLEVKTNASCSHIYPFIFEVPAQYVDLSQTSSDKLSLDILVDNTAVTLTDTDIAFFLIYPDDTTSVDAHWLTTGKTVGTGNYGTDPLAAGTTLTNTGGLTDASWTKSISDVNATQYRIDLDTSTNAGKATALSIRIEVYKPDIAAGELFIHPLLTLS